MPVRKIAISVPEDVLEQVDDAAAERGVSRSRLITNLLMVLARVRTDRAIERRINAVYADPEVTQEQVRTARAGAKEMSKFLRRAGNKW